MSRGPRRVYFIKPIGMDGPIKIGCSVSPNGRRETLECWSPFPLEVIAEIEGDFGIERRFHTAFAASYIKHEWFRVTPRLLATIAEINAGVFDIATLPQAAKLTAFRKARDNSSYTPEWRYEASIKARWRHQLSSWPFWDEDFKAIAALPGGLFAHRDEVEALFERRVADRRAA